MHRTHLDRQLWLAMADNGAPDEPQHLALLRELLDKGADPHASFALYMAKGVVVADLSAADRLLVEGAPQKMMPRLSLLLEYGWKASTFPVGLLNALEAPLEVNHEPVVGTAAYYYNYIKRWHSINVLPSELGEVGYVGWLVPRILLGSLEVLEVAEALLEAGAPPEPYHTHKLETPFQILARSLCQQKERSIHNFPMPPWEVIERFANALLKAGAAPWNKSPSRYDVEKESLLEGLDRGAAAKGASANRDLESDDYPRRLSQIIHRQRMSDAVPDANPSLSSQRCRF